MGGDGVMGGDGITLEQVDRAGRRPQRDGIENDEGTAVREVGKKGKSWVPPSRKSAAAPSEARSFSRRRPRPSSRSSRLPSPSTRTSVEPAVMVKITFLVELVARDDGGDQAVAKLVRIEQDDIDVQDGKDHKAPGKRVVPHVNAK